MMARHLVWLSGTLVGLVFGIATHAIAQPKPTKIERRAPATVGPEIGFMPGVPLAPHDVDPSRLVGVIDSGVQGDHPQIGNVLGPTKDFTGEGFFDHSGHGTQVVLVLLRALYQRMPQIGDLDEPAAEGLSRPPRIAVAKVVSRQPASAQQIADRIAAAVDWMAALDIRTVNISLALPSGAADYTAMCRAIERSEEILFAIASGNLGPDSVVYPAACPAENVIAFGAVRPDGTVPEYSGPADLVAELPPAPLPKAVFYLRLGDERAREGEIDAAEQAYRNALEANPTEPVRGLIEYGLGYVARARGEEDEALRLFMAAAQSNPSYAESFVALSIALTDRGALEEARSWIEQGLRSHPDNPRLLDRHARVLLDLARPGPALESIERLESEAPDIEGLADLRFAARNMLNVERAVDDGSDATTLLFSFAEAGDARLVWFMLRRYHVDLDMVPPGAKVPPLVIAALGGHVAVMRELLAAGAHVDGRDSDLRLTALMAAASQGHLRAVQLLLDYEAELDSVDYFGFTPLMFAAERGSVEVVELLVEAGADPSPKSDEGIDALGYAEKYGHFDVVSLISPALKAD